MKVIRARTAGFCMGVSLALSRLDRVVAEAAGPIRTMGPIIHNPQVLEEYRSKGVRRIDSPEEAAGSQVVIRAHGIPLGMEEALRRSGATIVDATCPKVKKAQVLIAGQTAQGRRLLLFGEADHPEVSGLLSYARGDALVFQSLDQLRQLDLESDGPWFLAAQTTQDREAFDAIVDHLLDRLGVDMPVLNTICEATRERQEEAIAIARTVPAIVVVGGFESGNTRRLAEVVRAQGIACQHVETSDQLDLVKLRGLSVVGLTAGASSPKRIIDEVQEMLEGM